MQMMAIAVQTMMQSWEKVCAKIRKWPVFVVATVSYNSPEQTYVRGIGKPAWWTSGFKTHILFLGIEDNVQRIGLDEERSMCLITFFWILMNIVIRFWLVSSLWLFASLMLDGLCCREGGYNTHMYIYITHMYIYMIACVDHLWLQGGHVLWGARRTINSTEVRCGEGRDGLLNSRLAVLLTGRIAWS
jgi:hypothetical protein